MKKCSFFAMVLTLALLCSLWLPTTSLAIEEMVVDGTAAILVDADYNEVLYAQDAHEQRYPASITKVMTALLAIEALERGQFALSDTVTGSSTFLFDISADSSTQNIKVGEELSVQDLLYCVLVPSANEACNLLAELVSGDVERFLVLMNERAQELGMTNTHFTNTHGLHNDDHYTTAYDISLMVMEALQHDLFAQIVSSVDYTVPATNLSDQRYFFNTNALLSNWKYVGYTYTSAIGVKTGHTPEAGYCLASAAVEDGRTLIAVVLGCERVEGTSGSDGFTYFSESKRLLTWGFDSFTRTTLLDPSELIQEVAVTLSTEADYVTVHPANTIEATVANDLNPASLQRDIVLFEEVVTAPVEKGQVLGQLTLSDGDTVYGTVDLVARNAVSQSTVLARMDALQTFLNAYGLALALLIFALLVILLIVIFRIKRKRQRKNYHRRSRYSGSNRR